MKKTLSMLLALALCLGLLPATALAAGDFQITDGVLVKYNGPGGDVVIPNGVAAIGEKAFLCCDSLTSVTIPNGVTSIGGSAFSGCSGLTSITIPDSVTTIGNWAFRDCGGLTSVTIPDSVTFIGGSAFFGCNSLTSLTIPDSVTTIGDGAFWACAGLTNVTIGNGVTSMGEDAFNDCSSLISVTIGNGVTTIGPSAFEDCYSLTSVTIPHSVTTIGEEAFENCIGLTSVTIGNSVTTIGWNAFYECKNLTSVTIPASVTSIGDHAFYGCENLTSVHGADGSYAQIYAQNNGNAFVADLPAAATPGRTAYAATQSILVDGRKVEFQCYALKDDKGNMTNYVKLRDVAYVLNGTAAQFNVGWDGKVSVDKGKPYAAIGSEMNTPYSGDRTWAKNGEDKVLLNGSSKTMTALQLRDADGNGYTYYPLRDLGQALGFNVGWAAGKGVYVETNKPYDPNN